jgi:hypothetical protein
MDFCGVKSLLRSGPEAIGWRSAATSSALQRRPSKILEDLNMHISPLDLTITDSWTPVEERLGAHGVAFIIPSVGPDRLKEGWSEAIDKNGVAAGDSFACHKCHLQIPMNAPSSVFHCGKREYKRAELTMTKRFGLPTMMPSFFERVADLFRPSQRQE